MRISIVLSLSLLFSMVFLAGCSPVLAQDSTGSSPVSPQTINLINTTANPGAVDIGESLIAPNSPLYFLKSVRESIEMMFTTTPKAQVARNLEFATRRLREVNTLIRKKRQDLIPSAMERYHFYIQEAGRKAFSAKDTQLQITVGEQVARQLEVLQRIYDQVGDERAKIAIRAAIFRLENFYNEFLPKLDLTTQQKLIGQVAGRLAFACNFLTREATSSGLNDTEKVKLQDEVGKCRTQGEKFLKDQLIEMRK
ncbi:MAG: hypothetical protein HYW45_02265 [Candidatus Daviesbacteria bacterium]|nr:MAG: hypothetical protein HYW45_02265 [Candidatus Daviesbacteria bacterium]